MTKFNYKYLIKSIKKSKYKVKTFNKKVKSFI